MRAKNKLVYGVGVNDLEESIKVDGKFLPVYSAWKSMLQRCYYSGTLQKNPTYQGCTVHPDWHLLSNFKVWFDANHRPRFHLDKDILIQGNKVYSPETCSYVPNYINYLIVNSEGVNGLGVSPFYTKRKDGSITTTYRTYCNNARGKLLRSSFKNPEDASAWYIETKKKIVSEVSKQALDRGEISQAVYEALIARKF